MKEYNDQPGIEFVEGRRQLQKRIKAAINMHEELRSKIMPKLHVGLLHGRLDADEKERVMQDFKKGEMEVLVSTTVIEVGVDVPTPP